MRRFYFILIFLTHPCWAPHGPDPRRGCAQAGLQPALNITYCVGVAGLEKQRLLARHSRPYQAPFVVWANPVR